MRKPSYDYMREAWTDTSFEDTAIGDVWTGMKAAIALGLVCLVIGAVAAHLIVSIPAIKAVNAACGVVQCWEAGR